MGTWLVFGDVFFVFEDVALGGLGEGRNRKTIKVVKPKIDFKVFIRKDNEMATGLKPIAIEYRFFKANLRSRFATSSF